MAEAGPQRTEPTGRNLARYIVVVALLMLGAAGLAVAGTEAVIEHTTASGLRYQMLKAGEGAPPGPSDTVVVHYVGTLPDGRPFDSSYVRGEPAQFRLDQVIPGWAEGLGLMKPGGRARFVIPAALAYGERGAGGVIPPNTDITFDVQLLGVTPAG